jgi:hypothetical protein
MFPEDFTVPADLGALSTEDLTAFRARLVEYAGIVTAEGSTATAAHLTEVRDLFASVNAEQTRRTEEANAAAAARAEIAQFTTTIEPPAVAPAVTETPAPVAPAEIAAPVEQTPATPVAVTAARNTIDPVPHLENRRSGVLLAAVGADTGRELAGFAEAGRLLEQRLSSYGSGRGRGTKTEIVKGSGQFKMDGRTLNRHNVVTMRREMDPRLVVTDTNRADEVIEFARSQSRLEGGSLIAAKTAQVNRGVALTAAAGWCAPSETIYDLCTLATLDGILAVPEIQATRGGFNIPENGGPSFASIYNAIGDGGDVILSEYDVENGVDKVCVEIPCPPFVEVRLDVAYLCITGALLQRRGYPEAVDNFSQQALIGLAHKVNQSVITRMVAQSGAAVVIPAVTNNTDGASQILAAVELAAIDMRYRHRMDHTTTLEIVLPIWALGPIRAAIARRAGVYELAVSDAEIMAWFAARNIAPNWVYDWQDAFSGQASSPGGATALTAYPANVQFLIYPAGTWVKPVRDVVNLDTVYDNALLTQNQYTALFVEDGFNVMKMCAESRLYQTPLSVGGVTGQNV